jgi:hypothetical protein
VTAWTLLENERGVRYRRWMNHRSCRGVASIVVGSLAAACGSADPQQNPDAGNSDAGTNDRPPVPKNAAVFAHTEKSLYRLKPDTLEVTLVGNFDGAFAADSMTDLAVDSTGTMIGISFTQVYRVNSDVASATRIGTETLQQAFNGLSFVPSQLAIGIPGPDVLVASRNTDGQIFQINPSTGAVSPLGNMGAFTSSGDIVAIYGFGMVATVLGPPPGGDLLVRLAPKTFAATPIGTGTGFTGLWGIGYWRNKLYGFGNNGSFVEISPSTGIATEIRRSAEIWWGAAVTTAAPELP